MSKVVENTAIGERLREFAGRFGSLKEFAEALDISQVQLSQYLAGRSKPGNKMQSRLRDLGCDIEWLMTGKKDGARGKKSKEDTFVAFHAPAGISEETKRSIQKLIDGLAELEPGDIESARRIIKEAFRKKK